MGKYLSRAAIHEARDFATREVAVPEWGGTVLVRELTALEADDIGFGMLSPTGDADPRKAQGMQAKLVAWATIDEAGGRIFSLEDIKALGKKSSRVIQRLANAVLDLSGMAPKEERLLTVQCEHCEAFFEVNLVQLEEQYEALPEGPPKNA